MEKNRDAEIEARLNMVAARAHRSLTNEELTLVRTRIERDLEHREEMRALPLVNGDSPDPGFNPHVSTKEGDAW